MAVIRPGDIESYAHDLRAELYEAPADSWRVPLDPADLYDLAPSTGYEYEGRSYRGRES